MGYTERQGERELKIVGINFTTAIKLGFGIGIGLAILSFVAFLTLTLLGIGLFYY